MQGNPAAGSGDINVFYDVRLVGFDSRSMSNGGGVDLALSFKNRPPCSDGGSTSEEDDTTEELTFGNLVCLSPGGQFRKVGIYMPVTIVLLPRNRTVRYLLPHAQSDPQPCVLTQEDIMWATVSELLKFKKSGRRLVLVRPLLPQLHNNGLSFADVVLRLTSPPGLQLILTDRKNRVPRKFLTNFFSPPHFFRCKSKNTECHLF